MSATTKFNNLLCRALTIIINKHFWRNQEVTNKVFYMLLTAIKELKTHHYQGCMIFLIQRNYLPRKKVQINLAEKKTIKAITVSMTTLITSKLEALSIQATQTTITLIMGHSSPVMYKCLELLLNKSRRRKLNILKKLCMGNTAHLVFWVSY